MSNQKSKEVAKREETAVVPASYLEGREHGGFDGNADKEMSIPFLSVLQAQSKQILDPDAIVDGAKPGLLLNTVSEEIYGTELTILPVLETMLYVEWVPRDKGGDGVPVARYSPKDPFILQLRGEKDFGKLTNPENGNDIIQTTYLWALILHEDGNWEPIVISITSMKFGPYNRWRKKASMFTVLCDDGKKRRTDLNNHIVKLSTRGEKKHGYNFFNLMVEPAGGSIRQSLLLDPEDKRAVAAAELRKLALSGQAKMAEEQAEGGAGAADDEDVEF
jgi:hypothetical protein